MCNYYTGENTKNKVTLCLTTLVHLFSHFELVIMALNPRSILQQNVQSLCLKSSEYFLQYTGELPYSIQRIIQPQCVFDC